MSLKYPVRASLAALLFILVTASIGAYARPRTDAAGQATPAAQPARRVAGGARPCPSVQTLDLPGTYPGALFLGKEDKKGKEATLTIRRDGGFEFTSGSFKGTGVIEISNSCGNTSVT